MRSIPSNAVPSDDILNVRPVHGGLDGMDGTISHTGWADVFPYFKKVSITMPLDSMDLTNSASQSTTFTPGAGGPFQTYDSSVYSDGPVQLTYTKATDNPSSIAFLESLSSIGVEPVQDLNLGINLGAKQEMLTVNPAQKRSSSYDNYYMMAKDRPNLKVLPNANVQQLILEKLGYSVVASGVVYSDKLTGSTLNVTARKEVILSAGAFQTPQLLLLSGIGPAGTLTQYGITPYVINDNVGQHMQDHTYFGLIAQSQADASSSSVFNDVATLQAAQLEYTNNASGPLTTPIGPTYAFQKLSESELGSLGLQQLVSRLSDQAHLEYLWESVYYPTLPRAGQYSPLKSESFFSITNAIVAPVSRGSVTIQSNSANDSPVINVNYLEAEGDQQLAIYALRNLRTVLAQQGLAAYTIGSNNGEVVPGAAIQSDEDILEYIKATLLPVWHACGTARMLPEAAGGVVDPSLKVYGVQGLRIVDASIMRVIPDNHIQGVVYMIAEKAADIIKSEYSLDMAAPISV